MKVFSFLFVKCFICMFFLIPHSYSYFGILDKINSFEEVQGEMILKRNFLRIPKGDEGYFELTEETKRHLKIFADKYISSGSFEVLIVVPTQDFFDDQEENYVKSIQNIFYVEGIPLAEIKTSTYFEYMEKNFPNLKIKTDCKDHSSDFKNCRKCASLESHNHMYCHDNVNKKHYSCEGDYYGKNYAYKQDKTYASDCDHAHYADKTYASDCDHAHYADKTYASDCDHAHYADKTYASDCDHAHYADKTYASNLNASDSSCMSQSSLCKRNSLSQKDDYESFNKRNVPLWAKEQQKFDPLEYDSVQEEDFSTPLGEDFIIIEYITMHEEIEQCADKTQIKDLDSISCEVISVLNKSKVII